jgi:hypothetical protein
MLLRKSCLLLICLTLPLPLAATPIRYIFAGKADGALGGELFGFTDFVVTVSADTDGWTPWGDPSSDYFGWETFVPTHSARVELAGFGVATVANALLVWANPNCACLGLSARPIANYSDFLLLLNTPFDLNSPYDLTTSIGPVSIPIAQTASSFAIFRTDLGDLRFDNAYQVTFEAALVPIAPAASLFAAALGTLVPRIRKRATPA